MPNSDGDYGTGAPCDTRDRISLRGAARADTVITSTRTTDRPSAETIRAGLADADRLRRSREASRRVWRGAPILAAACLACSVVSRLIGWPAPLVVGIFAAGVTGLAAHWFASSRQRGISDAIAARIDADANLRGELRSATWFAARDLEDPWVGFHLDRAAARLRGIDWGQLYPAVRAPRARIATAAMAIAAVVLAVVALPERFGLRADPSAARQARDAAAGSATADALPPELLKQLEELFAAAESSAASPAQRAATAAELRALLAQLSQVESREALEDLARVLDPGKDGRTGQIEPDFKALAERAKRSAELASLPPEVRQTFETLSEELSEADKSRSSSPQDPREAAARTKDNQPGDAAKASEAASVDESSIQSVKDASPGGGAGVLMMSSEAAPPGGEPGMGLGGGSSPNADGGTMAALAQALRKETVEASADNAGDNTLTEMRRKTEHGQATVTFSQSAAGAFDRGHAATPPAVPESRRQGVQTYFIRKQ